MTAVIIFVLLIAQSSATFFSEISKALGSVESKVGKLVTDLGTDIRDTYDCAVDVVEEFIYDKDQISKYYDKCKETSTQSSAATVVTDAPQTISIFIKPIELKTSKPDANQRSGLVVIDRDPKNIDKKLASVEQAVNNEYYRVDNMSSHLEHELNGLSKNVDEKLKMIEMQREDLQKTLLEIKKLHLEEEMEIEKTKEELRKVFNEILKRINSSTKESDLKSEMTGVMGDLEKKASKTILKEIEKWKEKGMKQLVDIQKAETSSTRSTSTESNIPRSFKELAAKISEVTSTTNHPNKDFSTNRPFISSSKGATTANPVKFVGLDLNSSTEKIIVTRALNASNTDTTSENPLTRSSTAATTISTTLTSIPTAFTTLSSIESVAKSPTVATTTQSTTTTQRLTTLVTQSTATTTESMTTTASSVNTTSTEPVTKASTISLTTSTETVTQAPTFTTTTSKKTEPPSTIATQHLTALTTPAWIYTKKPNTVRTTTVSTTSIGTTVQTIKKRHKKRGKKPRKNNKFRSTTPIPQPFQDDNEFAPKNTVLAVAEALKIFSESMKTKPALDNVFNHLDSVHASKIF